MEVTIELRVQTRPEDGRLFIEAHYKGLSDGLGPSLYLSELPVVGVPEEVRLRQLHEAKWLVANQIAGRLFPNT